MDKNYVMITFQNSFILRRTGVANFSATIKVTIMLIKITFKNSIKIKIITIFVLKFFSALRLYENF